MLKVCQVIIFYATFNLNAEDKISKNRQLTKQRLTLSFPSWFPSNEIMSAIWHDVLSFLQLSFKWPVVKYNRVDNILRDKLKKQLYCIFK